jgi:hypothetical protein
VTAVRLEAGAARGSGYTTAAIPVRETALSRLIFVCSRTFSEGSIPYTRSDCLPPVEAEEDEQRRIDRRKF